MFNSDAVVGNLATGAAWRIRDIELLERRPHDALRDHQGERSGGGAAGGGTIVKFTRAAGSGLVPVKVGGSNKLVWAYSAGGSKTLANHGSSHR
ncbi:hypothetical protein CLOM_g17074 [Closterium sp. NIES-68]|nr:hypothetical protein CLOM_g17074 [Closterium sp. NIES-68]